MKYVRWSLGALCVVWAISSLTWPFGWDQGILAWVGHVSLDGGMPYRDAWDMKGPLSYAVFAVAEGIFGRSTVAIRIVDLVFLGTGVLAVQSLLRRLTTAEMGWIAAAFFVLWYASGSYWHTAQPDGWAAMLILVAVALSYQPVSHPASWRLVAAGLLVGLATLIKPFYVVLAVVPLLAFHSQRRVHIRAVLILASAVTLPLVLTLIFFSYRGALGTLVEVYLQYPITAYRSTAATSPAETLTRLVEVFRSGAVFAVVWPLVAVGIVYLARRAPRATVMLVLWGLLAFAGVVLQGRFFTYHWIPVYGPLTVLSASGAWAITRPEVLRVGVEVRALALASLAVIAIHVVVHPLFETQRFLTYLIGETDQQSYYDEFGIPGNDLRAAQYLRQTTTAEDGVVIWGWNTAILTLADRETPTRFGFSLPLVSDGNPDLLRTYRSEFLKNLRRHPPQVVIVGPLAPRLLGRSGNISDFPAFSDIVHSCYILDERFGDIEIHIPRAGRRLQDCVDDQERPRT